MHVNGERAPHCIERGLELMKLAIGAQTLVSTVGGGIAALLIWKGLSGGLRIAGL